MTLKQSTAIAMLAGALITTSAFAKGNNVANASGMGNNQAQQQQRFAPNNIPAAFEAYDTNKDGTISEAEFNAFKEARMRKNADEGKQLRNAGNSPQFSDMDKDGDGKITKEELRLGQQSQDNTTSGQGKMRLQ